MSNIIKTWGIDNVCSWVTRMNMADKAGVIQEFSVDGPVLLTLSKKDLVGEMGFTSDEAQGFMKKLETWIQVTESMTTLAAGKQEEGIIKAEELVLSWDVAEVCDWVSSNGLKSIVQSVTLHNIDGPVLLTLTERDLTGDVGLAQREAQLLMEKIEALRSMEHC